MTGDIRAQTLRALRAAEQFEISRESLAQVLTASPDLLHSPLRVAEVEEFVRGLLLDGVKPPAYARPFMLPVLGNIAEAFVESTLVDCEWIPVYSDDTGSSAGHGVDLLMLDPSLTGVVAVEVKSTIQQARWPRLAPTSRAQMTPAWLDSSSNEGMREWMITSDDVYSMVVQAHLTRMRWRACIAAELNAPVPIANIDQLLDLTWLTEGE